MTIEEKLEEQIKTNRTLNDILKLFKKENRQLRLKLRGQIILNVKLKKRIEKCHFG